LPGKAKVKVLMKKPQLRIGVSGHQQLGDRSTIDFVREQFRLLLLSYQQQGFDLMLYAALAMGADQLFVQTSLEEGIPFEAVIPCTYYEAIFPSDDSRAVYQQLLHRAQALHQLPADICSDDTYLAAGEWLVDHCDLIMLAWNGLPPKGRGGTGDVASYARLRKRPFIHLDTLQRTVKSYGSFSPETPKNPALSVKREFTIGEQVVYQGSTITVRQYHLRMPNGNEVLRDIVERPESVLILPVAYQEMVLLVEEYDLGAGVWQLKLPGGKAPETTPQALEKQAQQELRQEIGYRAGKLERLLDVHSHPGYVAHKVHLFVGYDLAWDPLEMEAQEEIRVRIYTLQEALAETLIDYRCDPEAALALWVFAHRSRIIGLQK
jgi:8-oxo-dGTP pyrophosphatase MutT (NUDIX family)